MALIVPRLKSDTLELRAPGMLRLEIPLGLPDPRTRAPSPPGVGRHRAGLRLRRPTAAWFSKAIGVPCRLVRFHAEGERAWRAQMDRRREAPTCSRTATRCWWPVPPRWPT
jgi:hypothetical protein